MLFQILIYSLYIVSFLLLLPKYRAEKFHEIYNYLNVVGLLLCSAGLLLQTLSADVAGIFIAGFVIQRLICDHLFTQGQSRLGKTPKAKSRV